MTTSAQVLDVARSQIGTVEAKDGSNPYGRAYGMDKVAWCAEFVWWCFTQAGAVALLNGKTAYTPTLAQQFRAASRFSTSPQVGDVVFYDWPDSVRRIQHVGLVEAVEPAAIVTIEGNTSTGNQSDGGMVMRRRRARNASIVGYGRPAYTATAPPAVAPAPAQEDDMTPDQAKQLDLLTTQLVTGPDPKSWGWPAFPGGSGEKLTVVDYLRRQNERTERLMKSVDALTAALAAKGLL